MFEFPDAPTTARSAASPPGRSRRRVLTAVVLLVSLAALPLARGSASATEPSAPVPSPVTILGTSDQTLWDAVRAAGGRPVRPDLPSLAAMPDVITPAIGLTPTTRPPIVGATDHTVAPSIPSSIVDPDGKATPTTAPGKAADPKAADPKGADPKVADAKATKDPSAVDAKPKGGPQGNPTGGIAPGDPTANVDPNVLHDAASWQRPVLVGDQHLLQAQQPQPPAQTPEPTDPGPVPQAIGVRLDESAFQEGVLTDVEAKVRPMITNQLVSAIVRSRFATGPTDATADVRVTADFFAPRDGFPNGGATLRIDVTSPLVTIHAYPLDLEHCDVRFHVHDFHIQATIRVEPDGAASHPFSVAGVDSDIETPGLADIGGDGLCNWWYSTGAVIETIGRLLNPFTLLEAFGASSSSDPNFATRQTVEQIINDGLGSLDQWIGAREEENPGVGSLRHLVADDGGITAVADLDLRRLSGFHAQHAVSMPVHSDVRALLANRTVTGRDGTTIPTDVSFEINPNLVNQVMAHFTTAPLHLNFEFPVPESSVAPYVVAAADRGRFDASRWSVVLSVRRTPYLQPIPHRDSSGCRTGGSCFTVQSELTLPEVAIVVKNGDRQLATLRARYQNIGIGFASKPGTPEHPGPMFGPVFDSSGTLVFSELDSAEPDARTVIDTGDNRNLLAASMTDQGTSWFNGIGVPSPELMGHMAVYRNQSGGLAGDDRLNAVFDIVRGPQLHLTTALRGWRPVGTDGREVTIRFHGDTNMASPRFTFRVSGSAGIHTQRSGADLDVTFQVSCAHRGVWIRVGGIVNGTHTTPLGPYAGQALDLAFAQYSLGLGDTVNDHANLSFCDNPGGFPADADWWFPVVVPLPDGLEPTCDGWAQASRSATETYDRDYWDHLLQRFECPPASF